MGKWHKCVYYIHCNTGYCCIPYSKVNGSWLSVATSMQMVEISGLQEGSYEAYVIAIASVSSATAQSLPSTSVLFTVNPCKEMSTLRNELVELCPYKLLPMYQRITSCGIGLHVQMCTKYKLLLLSAACVPLLKISNHSWTLSGHIHYHRRVNWRSFFINHSHNHRCSSPAEVLFIHVMFPS